MSAPHASEPPTASTSELRDMLAALGWTSGQLAALAHCNPRTVRRWINGSREPPLHILSFLHASLLLLGPEKAEVS
jgi:DNA-binding transcriptional regulator YiaG